MPQMRAFCFTERSLIVFVKYPASVFWRGQTESNIGFRGGIVCGPRGGLQGE